MAEAVTDMEIVDIRDRNRKFDNAEDIDEIVREFQGKCSVKMLKFSGNTFGIPASEKLGTVLKDHAQIQVCHFNDMFTSRLKTEIAPSLQHISGGLTMAGVRLVELDLSDNAFGPNGVVGVTNFIAGPCCATLQILKMNNQGLGIGGGKLLADAIQEGFESTKGKGLRLKVFWAGRNRLENEGIDHLAKVLTKLGTLEDVAFYQNSIGVKGIEGPVSLALILDGNLELKHVNYSDNSIKPDGMAYLAQALKKLKNLRSLELDDCLLRTEGARTLARLLESSTYMPCLEKLRLEGNEIGRSSGIRLALALSTKLKLNHLALNSNEFGQQGVEHVMRAIESVEKLNTLYKPPDFVLEEPVHDDWEEIRQYAFGEDAGGDEEEDYEEDEYYDDGQEEVDDYEDEEDYEDDDEEEEDEESGHLLDTSNNTVVNNESSLKPSGFSFRATEEILKNSSPMKPSLFNTSMSSVQQQPSPLFKPAAVTSQNGGLFGSPLFPTTQQQSSAASASSMNPEKLNKLIVSACSSRSEDVSLLADAICRMKQPLDKSVLRNIFITDRQCNDPEQTAHAALELLQRGPLAQEDYEQLLTRSCVNILSVILTDNDTSKDNPVFTNASRAVNAILVHVGAIKPEVGDREMKKQVKKAEPYLKSHLNALSLLAKEPEASNQFSSQVRLSLTSVFGNRKDKFTTKHGDVNANLDEIVNAFKIKVSI